jgi:hypothetical protein
MNKEMKIFALIGVSIVLNIFFGYKFLERFVFERGVQMGISQAQAEIDYYLEKGVLTVSNPEQPIVTNIEDGL